MRFIRQSALTVCSRLEMILRAGGWAGMVLLALAAANPAMGQEKKIKLTHKETPLGTLLPGVRNNHLVFSPDSRHVAYPVKQKTGWFVAWDGKPGKTEEWILAGSVAFSPDSAQMVYVAQRGDKSLIVLNGKEGKEYAEIIRPMFSPDSKRLAFIARLKKGAKGLSVVVDGKESKEYLDLNPRSLNFSPDSKHLAFAADGVGDAEAKRVWVIDDKDSAGYTVAGPLVWSSDGTRCAFMGEHDDLQYAVIDGVKSKPYNRVGAIGFSADGKRVAFAAERKRQFLIVCDGVEGKEYDLVSEPIFSPDGSRLTYVMIRNKIWSVICDGKEGQGYDGVGDLNFSADSKHLVYKAVNEKKYRVVIDGKEGKEFDRIGTLVMNKDASRIAFAARDAAPEAVKEYMMLDGKAIPGAGNITMSPDARYVAHAVDTPLKSKVMVNDVEGQSYDGFLLGSKFVFCAPDRFVLIAAKGMDLFSVEVQITEE